MVRPRRIRLLMVIAGCLALAGALVPSGAVTAAAAGQPAQSSSSINDTASTRRIQLLAGGLAVLGIGLIGITVWFWRSTRPEPEALAPLEMMGRRRWRRLDQIDQRHRLDDVRAHLNDEAAEAARRTFAPDPVVPPLPPSPDVAEPAAVVAAVEAAPEGNVAVLSPPADGDVPADAASVVEVPDAPDLADDPPAAEVTVAEVPDAQISGEAVPVVEVPADAVAADAVPVDEPSGEHARVHGDPLVRATERDTGPG